MSSIMTNASAMTALQTLSSINKNLSVTQSRISTGLRVAEAADNAAYWSIATTMRSDNKANSVVQDALALGAAKVDTAYTAMNKSIEVVDQIKEKVLLAKNSSEVDRAKIQTEISELQEQLKDSIANASYAGSNLLHTDAADDTGSTGTDPDDPADDVAESNKFSVISSYSRASDGTVKTGSISFNLSETRLIDAGGANSGILDTNFTYSESSSGAGDGGTANILDLDVTKLSSDGQFDEVLSGVETALGSMAASASTLGAAKSRIDLQSDFVKSLSDAIDRGIGALVDADMNEESSRLAALQTQQQLAIQSLSIANSNAQNILALFR